MANVYLTLDLKSKMMYDDEDMFSFSFNHWNYDLKNRMFSLDDLEINYDLVSKIKYDRKINTDLAEVELEEGYVVDRFLDNEYEEYLRADFDLAVDKFVADKNLPDGKYDVKYTYFFDFSNDEFVIEVQGVEANE